MLVGGTLLQRRRQKLLDVREVPNDVGEVEGCRSGRLVGSGEVREPITIYAPEGTSAMALECQVPKGWHVTAISDDGMWDELHRKVKWGPFVDSLSRTVSFKARRLLVAVEPSLKERRLRGAKRGPVLAGTVSFDGVNRPIKIE